MAPKVTLLDLVSAVTGHARSDREVIATTGCMVIQGHVRFCETATAARLDLVTHGAA